MGDSAVHVSRYEKVVYEFILRMVTPLAHHSETFGNGAVAMRSKTRMPDGTFENIPIITGDSLRHHLREASAYALLSAAGMLDDPRLTEQSLRLLFNGGMISGKQDQAVKLDQYRELVKLMPQLSWLGGCAQNRSLEGHCVVENATLICAETLHRMPAWVQESVGNTVSSSREHIEEVQRVRMDASMSPAKMKLLGDGGAGVQQRLVASERAKEVGDAGGAEDAKTSMMPRRYEVVVAGSLFFWRVEAETFNELDLDSFNTSIAAFMANGRVGGKKGTGNGKFEHVEGRKRNPLLPHQLSEKVDALAFAQNVGSVFFPHVQANAKAVRKLLDEVDA